MKWNKGVDVFIMGHTPIPEVVIWVDENEKIKTYAKGSKVRKPRSY